MNIETAKKILVAIKGNQSRNKATNRTVKSIDVNEYDIIDIYKKQNGKCYWSGLKLDEDYNLINYHPFAISADRLNNSLGYTTENVVLCRRLFNLGRIDFEEKKFKKLMEQLRIEYDETSD